MDISLERIVYLCYNIYEEGGDAKMKDKIFIFKWIIAIFVGLVGVIIGVVGFMISYIEMGIFFSLFGVAIIIWYFSFVPHSFLFDNEKITIIYIFRYKIVKYINIKSCDKEESGVRDYPWGTYYHIIADKPFWQEIKIPSTKEIDMQIEKRIKIKK